MSAPEQLLRDALIVLVGVQTERIARPDGQITAVTGQVVELVEANEVLAGELVRLEHLLLRNLTGHCPVESEAGTPPGVRRYQQGMM